MQADKRKKQLTKKLNKVMLRRTKEDKLADQLPMKRDFICVCRLSDLQYRAYMCASLVAAEQWAQHVAPFSCTATSDSEAALAWLKHHACFEDRRYTRRWHV